MKNNILPSLDEAQHLDIQAVGGKAMGLIRSHQAGLAVPEAFIVPTNIYQAWLAPFKTAIAQYEQQHNANEKSQKIRALLQQQALSPELIQALQQLQQDNPDTYFAVRSSGSAEDLPGAAFAGLHDTLLNVHGVAALQQAVLQCWLSLWNPEVIIYRERLGVPDHAAAMAIVIQKMVNVGPQDAAGVAFSIDPVGEDIENVLINAAFGLGETVVAGEAEVDEFRINAQGAIDSQHIAQKTHALVRAASGSTLLELPITQQQQPALNAQQAKQVAELARLAEQHATFPQDIEWAFEGDQLYLLQSRAVTRFAPRWTRDESAERFPNPVTPLTWQLCEDGFHQSLNYSFQLMGLPPFHDKWFVLKDNYVYGNQNAVRVYAGRMPIASLNSTEKLAAFIESGGLWQFTWISELPTRWMNDLDSYLLAIGRLNDIDYQHKSITECWEILQQINTLGTAYFLPNIAISLTQSLLYQTLRKVLEQFIPSQAQQVFDQLIATTETKTALVNQAMWELSRLLRQHDELYTRSFENTQQLQDALRDYPKLAKKFQQFLAQHGHREVDFDAYHATWLEAPHLVFSQIQLMAKQQEDHHTVSYWQKRDQMLATELEILKAVPETFRFFLQELIRLVRTYTALDDIEHYHTTRLNIPFRRAAHEIGKRLVNYGALDDAWDVFFIPPDTLGEAIASQDFSDIRHLAATEKARYQHAQQHPAAWVYGEENIITTDHSGERQGLAGSSGQAEGEVFVITDPNQFVHFPSGAILVAKTTNPAWTPLFYQAKAVITESGGPLSHGAVTARELGIPAVMSIRDACSWLQSGDHVIVDGQKGTVRRCEST
ncbi:PEP/pyruvate-binding domain-containing protein [Acinetobacter larvae]|uniref:Phosphoenolpyruvate synthase n=1 Tax=Acinetobacter larvae TaxID=1789224 RepID=A0A1B2LVG5_9GAMM|nr:PEP/pyruvate-binding domain-containing protein [Acinetobacter larvae]AOA56907.1 phosphoenolpyruvate synthase [Acinetobacter larvae]